MKFKSGLLMTALTVALGANPAFAQGEGEEGDVGDLGVTFVVLPEHVELPVAVTRELELPRDAEGEFRPPQQAIDNNTEGGLETANSARESGRTFGQETAAAAQENVENLGRGSRPDLGELVPEAAPPDLTEIPPEVPNPPELPGRPDTPAGPPGE